MSITINNGRLGNQIIRNIAVSFIAKKHNLYVIYVNNELIKKLGIDLYCGTNKYDKNAKITDGNYFDILYKNDIDHNIDANNDYFQTIEISRYINDWLHSKEIKNKIIDSNPYKERYNNNNDIFIHVRLGDATQHNVGYKYYSYVIDTIKNNNLVNNIYISSDSPQHEIVKKLLNEYNTQLFNKNEIETIQFGSTAKYIILSHGSFSAIIGWLGFFSNIFYKKYDENHIWFGDMFSIRGWNMVKL